MFAELQQQRMLQEKEMMQRMHDNKRSELIDELLPILTLKERKSDIVRVPQSDFDTLQQLRDRSRNGPHPLDRYRLKTVRTLDAKAFTPVPTLHLNVRASSLFAKSSDNVFAVESKFPRIQYSLR